MRFSWGGIKFKIWFKYEGKTNRQPDGMCHQPFVPDRRETLCFIDEEDAPGITFATGSAICAASDVFCKNTGRKVALTKALRCEKIRNVCGANPATEKQFRTAAWQCYLKRAEQEKKGVESGH